MKDFISIKLVGLLTVLILMATAFMLGKLSTIRDYESTLKMCVGEPRSILYEEMVCGIDIMGMCR